MPIRGKVKTEGLIFCVENDIELSRVETLTTKEEGTIRWLDKLQPGDVFVDVGANIGCYTLWAARRAGADGRVYAFEPHVGNAHKLLKNVEANGFRDRVTVITAAVGATDGWTNFRYASANPGSSGSQAFREIGAAAMVAVEWKPQVRLDTLYMSKPRFIKIDVDGSELCVLLGMTEVMTRNGPIVQVEMPVETRADILGLMTQRGYKEIERHHTLLGKRRIAAGAAEEQVVYNAVFERGAGIST